MKKTLLCAAVAALWASSALSGGIAPSGPPPAAYVPPADVLVDLCRHTPHRLCAGEPDGDDNPPDIVLVPDEPPPVHEPDKDPDPDTEQPPVDEGCNKHCPLN